MSDNGKLTREAEQVAALSKWLHENRPEAERALWAGDLLHIVRVAAPPAEVTDEMVGRYCDAVAEYLGGLPEEQWAEDRKDHIAATRRVSRIGLEAALDPTP